MRYRAILIKFLEDPNTYNITKQLEKLERHVNRLEKKLAEFDQI